VLEELNVRSLVPCDDTLKYALLRAEPDFRYVFVYILFNSGIYPDLMLDDIVGLSSYSVLGKRLGKHMGIVAKEVKAMSQESILAFEKSGEVTLSGHCLKLTDIKVLILLADIIHISRGSL
jgi:isoleucyl-tRNA synthetase